MTSPSRTSRTHPIVGPSRRTLIGLVLLVSALALPGCRLVITADLDVTPQGTATAAITLDLDAALVAELETLAVDPTAELGAVVAATPGWALERVAGDDGGVRVRLTRDDAPVEVVVAELRGFADGLAARDPALLIDLEVALDAEGGASVAGTGGLRLPSTAGAVRDGQPVGPAGDDLAALLTDAVDASLVVTLPGVVVAADADAVDDTSLRWDLPVGATRELQAVTEPTPVLAWGVTAAFAVAILVLLVAVVWIWRRLGRRRRRRRVSRVG